MRTHKVLHNDCDTRIYERLTDLEIDQGKADERLKNMEEFSREVKQDIKALSKKVTISEVRLAVIIGAIIWAVNHFLK